MRQIGHVDMLVCGRFADGCGHGCLERKEKMKRKRKEKIKNEKDILSEVGVSVRMGRVEALACGRADADGCKKKRKEERGYYILPRPIYQLLIQLHQAEPVLLP